MLVLPWLLLQLLLWVAVLVLTAGLALAAVAGPPVMAAAWLVRRQCRR